VLSPVIAKKAVIADAPSKRKIGAWTGNPGSGGKRVIASLTGEKLSKRSISGQQ